MRVLCAPDKFKQACTAAEAAHAMATGAMDAVPGCEAIEMPLADGGEGTLEILRPVFPDQRPARVKDALGREVEARFALSADGRRALVESAQACGLWRIEEPKRDPVKTSTHGVGQLIRAALDAGAKDVLLGIGGTATSDGGAGMAEELGARFYDGDGREFVPNGGELLHVRRVDLEGLDPRLAKVRVTALCDVMTPMLGAKGASRKYILQKGGTTRSLAKIEESLTALVRAARQAGRELTGTEPGTGCGGGLGFGVASLLGGQIKPGAAAVLHLLGFEAMLQGVDLVLTGEGSYDAQTAEGKLISALAMNCKRANVPLCVLAGVIEPNVPIDGVTAAFSIARYGARKQDNLTATDSNLRRHAAAVTRLVAAARR